METLTSYAPAVSNLCCSNRRNGNISSSPALIHHLRYPISSKTSFGKSHFISLRYLTSCQVLTQADVVNVNSVPEPSRSKTVHVRFQLQKQCMFGEQFLVVGDDPVLGLWEPANAIPLEWSDGHIWTVNLDLPVGKSIFYKFILKGVKEEVFWQPGPNRMLETGETMKTIVVSEDWEDVEAHNVTEELYEKNIQEADPETINDVNVTTAEEPMMNEKFPLESTKDFLAAKTILGEDGTVAPGNAQDDNLVSYAGEPVLVPGLTPLTSREGVISAEPDSKVVSDVDVAEDISAEPESNIVSDAPTVADVAEVISAEPKSNVVSDVPSVADVAEVISAEPESNNVSKVADVAEVISAEPESNIVSDVSTVADVAEEPGMPKHESGLEETQQVSGEHDRAQCGLEETQQVPGEHNGAEIRLEETQQVPGEHNGAGRLGLEETQQVHGEHDGAKIGSEETQQVPGEHDGAGIGLEETQQVHGQHDGAKIGSEETQQVPGEHDGAEHQTALHESQQTDSTWGRKTLQKFLANLGLD